MVDVIQFLTCNSTQQAKTESKIPDGSSVDDGEFERVLQGAKDSTVVKSGKMSEENRVGDKTHIKEDEGTTEEDASLSERDGTDITQPLFGCNWVNHQLLVDTLTDIEASTLNGDEGILYISNSSSVGDSSHTEETTATLSDDAFIILDDESMEALMEGEYIANNDVPKLEDNNQHNDHEAFLHKEADFYLDETTGEDAGSSVNTYINDGPNTKKLDPKVHIQTEDRDFFQDDATKREQPKISMDDQVINKTIHGKKGQPSLSEVSIEESISIVEDSSKKSLSSDEQFQNNEKVQLNSLGFISNDSKDVSLDFSKVLNRQDSIEHAQIISQLADKAVAAVGRNGSELEVQIRPEHLGKLVLKVALEDGLLTGKIYTSNDQIKEYLQGNLEELKTTLKDQGFVFTSLDVDVGSQPNPNTFNYLGRMKSKVGKVGSLGNDSKVDVERIVSQNASTSKINLSQIDYLA